MTEKKQRKKFKYTRELVRIAIDDGMTQMEIAALCRVQQSKVSAWSRGESKALEHEVAELKKRYGHRLNRTTSRIYLAAKEDDPPVNVKWEDTEHAKRLLDLRTRLEALEARQKSNHRCIQLSSELSLESSEVGPEVVPSEQADLSADKSALETELEELRRIVLKGAPNWFSIEGLIKLDRENLKAAHEQKAQLTQVEGPIVLRYTFVKPERVVHGRTEGIKRLPIARWLIHRQPDGRFVLVTQSRRTLWGSERLKWWNTLRVVDTEPKGRRHMSPGIDHEFFDWMEDAYVECADDSARWLSYILGPTNSETLLTHCDKYFADANTLHSPHDELTLPFLLRKMLVEQAEEVPGLVRIVTME